ncbi:MAG: hypothetical protein JOY91_14245 [Sinobacteraceae bacterium]|nr:hypothetical protein [Nevskiaceae bacterium]
MGRLKSVRFFPGLAVLAWAGVAVAQNAETTRISDVYAGPDDSYPVVAQLDADTPVQVMGCLNDWSWCDIGVGDNRGWLYAPDLAYDYEGGYVPFYTYAPSFGIPVEQFTVGEYWDRYYHERPWYGRRAEWMHRSVSEHRRPSGPPPSAGPPPRSARLDHPSHDAGRPEDASRARNGQREGDRPIRLGSAEDQRHPSPQERAGPGRAEVSPAPRQQMENNAPRHEQPREERAPQAQRAEGPRREAPVREAPVREAPAREAPAHEPAAREERQHERPSDNPH